MAGFNDMRLKWKLLGSFGAVLALMLVIGGVGVWGLRSLTEDVRAVAEQEMAAVVAVLDLQDGIRTIQRDVRQALLVDNADASRAAAASVAASQKRVAADVAELERLLYLPAGQAKLATLKKAYADWSVHIQKIVDLESKGNRDGSKAELFHPDTVKTLDFVNVAIADLTELKKARAATVVAEAQENGRAATLLIATVSALAVVLGLGVALYLARSITRAVAPLERTLTSLADKCATWLAGGLRAVADGDLTVSIAPVTPPIVGYSKDELGQLAATANSLRNKIVACVGAYEEGRNGLAGIVTEVRTNAAGVADTSQQLGAATGQTSAAVQQVTAAMQNVASGATETSRSAQSSNDAVDQLVQVIDNVARGAQEQARQIQVASETTSRMVARIDEVAGNAQAVAAASQQTKASAENGASAVQETVTGMAEIKAVVGDAAGKVEELGKLGEKIGAVVETIDDIAEQTNLLALNAAIEAARAGEHGRGFAVVADEVRKLAERSQRETKAIADLIRDVQAGTKDAVKAMELGSAKVELGTLKADQAGRSLSEILTAVEATVGQVGGIAAAAQEVASGARAVVEAMDSISVVIEESSAPTEEMSAQAGQVSGAIQAIAAVSEESSASTEEVSASAEEMSAQMEEISAQADQLASTAQQLNDLVARFQLEAAPESSPMVHRRRPEDWLATRRTAGSLRAI